MLLFTVMLNGQAALTGIAKAPPLPLKICFSIRSVVDRNKKGGGSAELLMKTQSVTRTFTLLREASFVLYATDRPPLLPWNGFLVK